MPLTGLEFVERVRAVCPDTRRIVDEHFSEQEGELLLHLLVADIRRFAIARFDVDDTAVLGRCLDVLATGLTGGDDYVRNAIAVSFVEDTGWWDSEMNSFVEEWPTALREEAARQRRWYLERSTGDDG